MGLESVEVPPWFPPRRVTIPSVSAILACFTPAAPGGCVLQGGRRKTPEVLGFYARPILDSDPGSLCAPQTGRGLIM